jgi:7,8-dihydropterin-6-yl-methyl-4-(beta-D-ribofuranosyl)aminobenzene 5'-phosphate synthase
MMAKTRITVLVEDTASGPGLLAEHGLAYWIEYDDHRVLLDSGQGGALMSNAHTLGIRLSDIEALALSHGHYDHTGGVAEVLGICQSVAVHAHPAALAQKFVRNNDGTAREIGMPDLSVKAIRDLHHRLVITNQPIAVFDELAVSGPVPWSADFEDTGGPYFLDEICTQPDPLKDDQSMFFSTSKGTVVLLGCAHSGVINTLHHIRRLTNNRPIHAVIGGMHLVNASSHRIERTIEELRKIGVERLAPAHCTGMQATMALSKAFPGQCQPCSVGTRFEFD